MVARRAARAATGVYIEADAAAADGWARRRGFEALSESTVTERDGAVGSSGSAAALVVVSEALV